MTEFVTGAIGWIGQFLDLITEQPLLLVFIIAGFTGMAITLIRRLMHV